jgi:hypothetical protein
MTNSGDIFSCGFYRTVNDGQFYILAGTAPRKSVVRAGRSCLDYIYYKNNGVIFIK